MISIQAIFEYFVLLCIYENMFVYEDISCTFNMSYHVLVQFAHNLLNFEYFVFDRTVNCMFEKKPPPPPPPQIL